MKKLLTIICLSFIFGVGNVYADESSSSTESTGTDEKNYIVQDVTYSNVCVKDGGGNWYCDNPEQYTILDPANPDKKYKWFLPDDTSNNAAVGAIFSVSEDGTKEYINHWIDEKFQGSGSLTINGDRSYVDASTGKVVIYTNNGYREFDPKDNSFSLTTNNHTTESGTYFKGVKPLDDLIREESDGSIHIGEDSLVTVEEDGKQQLYATDANGNQIDINIKKGTDLLIDGVSVSGSLNTNATNIATNKTNIATNTTDIATNKTNIASNTTDIATNVTNIAANTAEIATQSTSIASNTTAIAALGSNLSAFKASTNSQMNYMKSDYSSGIASAIAMSQFNLAQEGFSVGIGRGSYNDEDETAFGLGYGGEFKNGTLFKLQASKSGDASGVGLTISF